ncbi:glycosyltransferase family 9 protein [Uliginosibacterium sp. H3]|uniref:Glycosyltransferase family 9 protein n=1 Tax=Uliginosibacterium silvisoli TaxID=3114758 RepID=A0ABU6K0W4_9RHOO|nr:glycosyltransferase family 9 protein [Uliginosibacterium sp. H3]
MEEAQVQQLLRQGDVLAARRLVDAWLAAQPDHLLAVQYQGLTRLYCGDAPGAEESFRHALALDAALPRNIANLGIALMAQGRYADGLPLYESRYASNIVAHDRVSFPGLAAGLQWQGEPLAGRRLLLVREQGFGDQIQFIRFAPQLHARGASRVLAWVSPGLGALFSSVRGLDVVTEAAPAADSYDLWCPLMSLPLLLGLNAPQAADELAYLRAPARTAHWQQQVSGWTQGRPTVGVVWAGNAGNSVDARRSLPTELMLDMLAQRNGRTALSLQLAPGGMDQLERQCRDGIIPLLDMLSDFSETAAVIEQLDLVISVDTAVAHLAGALGKPVWLLLPAGPDWRWGRAGERSDWYPTMRLFRQPEPGDWRSVVDAVKQALLT